MSNRIFNPAAETMSQDELRALQQERLHAVFKHVYENNAIKRAQCKMLGVRPEDIRTLEDLPKIPTMSKEDLRKHYPMELSCVEQARVAEIHMSSGSTGTPIVMPYTEADLDQWGECMARCIYMAGGQAGDVIQITPSLGLFNGGFGFYHGARKAGLFIVPASAGNTPRQLRLARDFNTTIMTGVVSYGIRMMEVLLEEGFQLPALKYGMFGAETFSESLRAKIEKGLGIAAFDIYGMTETGGVGTLGMDCCAHDGIHVWDDHYIIEVIDRETGRQVPDGQFGELVVTSLTREALPVLRFKTGDLTRILSREKCACGRTHTRIASITGRVDDMMIVKGVNFFPRQVEQALMTIPGVHANYQIILEEVDGVKDVRINVEAEAHVTGYMVEKVLKEALGFSPKGDVFAPGSLPRVEVGKAQRVFRSNGENAMK